MPGSHQARQRALEICRRAGVQALTVPSCRDLMSGKITVSQVRNIEADIGIQFTGLRPGEKLYEELLADGEHTLPTPHPKLRIAKSRATPDSRWMEDLLAWMRQGNHGAEQVRQELAARVPEYTPQVRSIEQNEGTRPLVLP